MEGGIIGRQLKLSPSIYRYRMKLRGVLVCVMCMGLCLGIAASDALSQAFLLVLDENQHYFCEGYEDQYDVYIWVYPDTAGVVCAEYQFILPSYMMPVTTEANPGCSVVEGTLEGPPGATVCFQSCRIEPVWTSRFHCLIVPGDCFPFEIIEHEVSGDVRVTTCSEPDSFRGAIAYWYNPSPCCTCPGTEESTWGAIRLLYW
jgi:hypothetical protein